jgi:muramoyltetrapeptide carboxypeptidase
MRNLPPKLKPGDKIAIAASARKITIDELKPAIAIFESWGLEIILHPELFAEQNQFAGSDDIRARVLNSYLQNTDIKAVIFARGGYGTVRIIDQIDFSFLDKCPKWLIGYSDITVLHNHVHANTNWCTLHATMPINMQNHNLNNQSVAALKSMLMDDTQIHYPIEHHPLNRNGNASAQLVGGNLSVMYSLLRSASDIDTKNKILFLEDLDEYLYHIDRMMQALKRAGKLEHLAGLIIGGMSDMKDNAIPFGLTAEEIIADTVKDFSYPVLFNFPAGHQDLNLPILLGGKISLKVDNHFCQLVCS